MNNRVVVVGTGQQSRVVEYNLRIQGQYQIVAYLDVDQSRWGRMISGVPILSGYTDYDKTFLDQVRNEFVVDLFFLSIGNMALRRRLYCFMCEQGWASVRIIHPNAVVSSAAEIGNGVLIEAGCLITPNPIIGNNVVINTGSQINHDNVIGDHVYIASGVILSGGVEVGEGSLIDDGVIVSLGRKIGTNCIIGAGSVVTKDIPDSVVAYGNPCRVIRSHDS